LSDPKDKIICHSSEVMETIRVKKVQSALPENKIICVGLKRSKQGDNFSQPNMRFLRSVKRFLEVCYMAVYYFMCTLVM